jgi:hypothetical protein
MKLKGDGNFYLMEKHLKDGDLQKVIVFLKKDGIYRMDI